VPSQKKENGTVPLLFIFQVVVEIASPLFFDVSCGLGVFLCVNSHRIGRGCGPPILNVLSLRRQEGSTSPSLFESHLSRGRECRRLSLSTDFPSPLLMHWTRKESRDPTPPRYVGAPLLLSPFYADLRDFVNFRLERALRHHLA